MLPIGSRSSLTPKSPCPSLKRKLKICALSKVEADYQFNNFELGDSSPFPIYNPDNEMLEAMFKNLVVEEGSVLRDHLAYLGYGKDSFLAPLYYQGKFWKCCRYVFDCPPDTKLAALTQLRQIDVENYVNVFFAKMKKGNDLAAVYRSSDLLEARIAIYKELFKHDKLGP